MPNRALVSAGWLLAAYAFWLLLAASAAWDELVAGGAAAALAATAFYVVSREEPIGFRPRLAWVRQWLQLPVRIAVDTGVVFVETVRVAILRRSPRSNTMYLRYRFGEQNPTESARRAIDEGAASLGPNGYVVAIDPDDNVAIVHNLVPSQAPDQVFMRRP